MWRSPVEMGEEESRGEIREEEPRKDTVPTYHGLVITQEADSVHWPMLY